MQKRHRLALMLLTSVCFVGATFGQSREQRLKANEFKCSFTGRCLTSKGGDKNTTDYGIFGYSKTKTKGMDCIYTIRLNSKTQEVFTIETYFMAKQNKRTFPFAKNEVEVALKRGFTTNIVVTSPELTLTNHKLMSGSGKISCCKTAYTYSYSKEGAAVVGASGRLKKDGVIIKTYYTMGPWEKLSWQPTIDMIKVQEGHKDPPVVIVPPPVCAVPVRKND